jgi:hypothetical protein
LEQVEQDQALILIKDVQDQLQLFQQYHLLVVVKEVVAQDQLVQAEMVDQVAEEHQVVVEGQETHPQ